MLKNYKKRKQQRGKGISRANRDADWSGIGVSSRTGTFACSSETRNTYAQHCAAGRSCRVSCEEGERSDDTTTDGDELLWFIAEELKLLPVFEELAPPPTTINKAGTEVECRTMYAPLLAGASIRS